MSLKYHHIVTEHNKIPRTYSMKLSVVSLSCTASCIGGLIVNDNVSASYPLYNGITCFEVESEGRDIGLFNATPRRTVVEA